MSKIGENEMRNKKGQYNTFSWLLSGSVSVVAWQAKLDLLLGLNRLGEGTEL